MKKHTHKFIKKIYNEEVEDFRRKMYDLMMNDEPLVQEEPFDYLDKEEEKLSEIASVNKLSAGSVQQS